MNAGGAGSPGCDSVEDMPLDWQSGPLAQGLSCYRSGEFFEAHEHWEAVWLGLAEPEKSFLQALIQMTAAFHHLASGNPPGARSLLTRALRRLAACPACFGGIPVEPLVAGIGLWLESLEAGAVGPRPAFPPIHPLATEEGG